MLLITKVTKDGRRTADKQPITDDAYREHLANSVQHLEKVRHEFTYRQNDIDYGMKYDVFADQAQILEVDAATNTDRESFDVASFPYSLDRIIEDIDGPKVVDWLAARQAQSHA